MNVNQAIGMTVAQYLFAHGLTRADLGALLGIAGANVSNRLHGKAKWTAEDLLATSARFGIPVDALMPTPDGSGGWVPAPYVPAGSAQMRRDPVPSGTGSVVVAGTGFEPATSGVCTSF